MDIAEENREIVTILRRDYKDWYEDVSERFGEYCEIVLGSLRANPTTLTCHDWHGPGVPWNQTHIASRMKANGYWAVEVERAGQYEIVLRERPAWWQFPLKATSARLKIGDTESVRPVQPGTSGVAMVVDLKAGKTKMQTWLLDRTGEIRGAYFVDVKYLGPSRS